MRLLADENFPGAAVDLLRKHGHDVAWVRAEHPDMDDQGVVRSVVEEARVRMTSLP